MEDDYTQDEDIMNDIADAKAYSYGGKTQVKKHGTDLHVLVAGKANPSTISVGLESPNFRAFLNAKNDDGMTPLMIAAEELFGDAARLLYSAGADVTMKNKKGQTALDIFNRAYADGAEELGDTRAEQEDTAKWFRGFLWDAKADAQVQRVEDKVNTDRVFVDRAKQGLASPEDLQRLTKSYLGGRKRKTRARKTKRRLTRRRK
jgi:hypothetical protein